MLIKTYRKDAVNMDMRETVRWRVGVGDVDRAGFIRPSALALKLASSGARRSREEGASKDRIWAELKAVWMFRRIRLCQLEHIRLGDELAGTGSGRTVCENEYALRGELYKNGRLAARADMIMMPVVLGSRKRLLCRDIEPFFNTRPLNEVSPPEPLPAEKGLIYDRRRHISMGDCDTQARHFAFHSYVGLVCRETGFGDLEHPLIPLLQIDYIKEIAPGGTLDLGVLAGAEGYFIAGKHLSGKLCFRASCRYTGG